MSPPNYIVKSLLSSLLLLLFTQFAIAQTAALDPFSSYQDEELLITMKNNSLVFEGLSDFQIASGYKITGIIDNPENGKAIMRDGSRIIYSPQENLCDQKDAFSYIISNGSTENIKHVNVDILCQSLAILSSFSPNGDGRQDSFIILGIDNFPSNELIVFNDLGQIVFRKSNYLNDWDGTYNGYPLPSGLYFYVFDTGEGDLVSGYLWMGIST